MMLATIVFVAALGSVFFKSMILWKGLELDFDFLHQMADAVKDIAKLLRFPGFEHLFV